MSMVLGLLLIIVACTVTENVREEILLERITSEKIEWCYAGNEDAQRPHAKKLAALEVRYYRITGRHPEIPECEEL